MKQLCVAGVLLFRLGVSFWSSWLGIIQLRGQHAFYHWCPVLFCFYCTFTVLVYIGHLAALNHVSNSVTNPVVHHQRRDFWCIFHSGCVPCLRLMCASFVQPMPFSRARTRRISRRHTSISCQKQLLCCAKKLIFVGYGTDCLWSPKYVQWLHWSHSLWGKARFPIAKSCVDMTSSPGCGEIFLVLHPTVIVRLRIKFSMTNWCQFRQRSSSA